MVDRTKKVTNYSFLALYFNWMESPTYVVSLPICILLSDWKNRISKFEIFNHLVYAFHSIHMLISAVEPPMHKFECGKLFEIHNDQISYRIDIYVIKTIIY